MEKAKHTLLYSGVGLAIVIAAFVISNIITDLATSAFGKQANDFLPNEYGRAIASQSSLRILMRQDTTTIKGVVSEFNLSEYEESFLLTCRRGDALVIATRTMWPYRW